MSDTAETNTHTLDDPSESGLDGLPAGDHPLEVAARAGFGPLSPAAEGVWHGDARPCVTCGQLVRRAESSCHHCGQDLSPTMLERMRAHAGPWYVLEHLRPFPGVSLDRVVRQVHRGLITATSIVRGPTTDYQWRFAIETPGLCRMFRRCWRCFGEVTLAESNCRMCGASLSFDRPVSQAGPGNDTASSQSTNQTPSGPSGSAVATSGPGHVNERGQLAMLRAAAHATSRRHASEEAGEVMKVGGVRLAWLAAIIVVGVFVGLVAITKSRRGERPRQADVPRPSVVLPQRGPSPLTKPSEP